VSLPLPSRAWRSGFDVRTLPTHVQEDFTIHVTKGAADDEVVVNMRTRARTSGGLDGNERITGFLNELREVRRILSPSVVLPPVVVLVWFGCRPVQLHMQTPML
jgi:endonuclease V-like protein UPF0215 family